MNKKLIAVSALVISAFASNAFAEDGKVNFTGTIIDQGCEVTADTVNQTVNLGKIAKSAFPAAGATAGAKGFSLVLEKCPETVTAATVRFDGTQVPGNNSILALSTESVNDVAAATGVGIQISDNQNKIINLYEDSSSYALSSTAANTLNFVASYISTAAAVTPGVANAVSNFTIVYQ